MWEKGEGGQITQTLAEGLLLPDNVHAFEDGSEESVGRRLEWHAIAVILLSINSFIQISFYFFSNLCAC